MKNLINMSLFAGALFLAAPVSADEKHAEKSESEASTSETSIGATNEPSIDGNTNAMQAGDQPDRPKSGRLSEEQIMEQECQGKSGKILADCQTQVHLDYQSGNYN